LPILHIAQLIATPLVSLSLFKLKAGRPALCFAALLSALKDLSDHLKPSGLIDIFQADSLSLIDGFQAD